MTFVEQLTAALRTGFDDAPGQVAIAVRDWDGFQSEGHVFAPPFTTLPFPLIRFLSEELILRVSPITRQGGGMAPVALTMAVARWRPDTTFDQGRWRVVDESAADIAQKLASLPPASIVVDAGPEVWAAWRLEDPITDMEEAAQVLSAIAARVDGDIDGLSDLATMTLPLAGWIRDWSGIDREAVTIVRVDPTLRYRCDDLLMEQTV